MTRKKIPTALKHANTWRSIHATVTEVLLVASDSKELRKSALKMGVSYEEFIAASISTLVRRELLRALQSADDKFNSDRAEMEKRSCKLVNHRSSTAQKPTTMAKNRGKNRAVRGGAKPIPSKTARQD